MQLEHSSANRKKFAVEQQQPQQLQTDMQKFGGTVSIGGILLGATSVTLHSNDVDFLPIGKHLAMIM